MGFTHRESYSGGLNWRELKSWLRGDLSWKYSRIWWLFWGKYAKYWKFPKGCRECGCIDEFRIDVNGSPGGRKGGDAQRLLSPSSTHTSCTHDDDYCHLPFHMSHFLSTSHGSQVLLDKRSPSFAGRRRPSHPFWRPQESTQKTYSVHPLPTGLLRETLPSPKVSQRCRSIRSRRDP